MSKSDRPLDEVDTSKASSPRMGKPHWAGDKTVNALDFETAAGQPFMLAYSLGDGRSDVAKNIDGGEPRPLGLPTILKYLTWRPLRDGINVWFNLNFDANVLLGELPDKNLKELQVTCSTEFETPAGREFSITYIKKKFLRIQVNDDSYWHYDISQFAYGSLEDAAQEWLGGDESKDKPPVDPTDDAWDESFDAENFRIGGAIAEHWQAVRRYAEHDADLTRRLAAEIIRVAEHEVDPPIPFGRPISTGSVAADFVKDFVEYKPEWGATAVQKMAWEAYSGGRFEVFERGSVDGVAGPDINSAYPWVMSELPCPGSLDWHETTSVDELRDAELGFVRATVSTDASRRIQPFAVKNEKIGRVEYPALDGVQITTLAPTFLFALDEGLITDYEIERAFIGRETAVTRYPFDFLNGLYDKRKRLESDGRDKPAKLLKIVMNSLYGKTCQITPKTRLITPEMGKIKESDLKDWERGSPSPFGNMPIIDSFEAGTFFNPVLASYITGMTRLELHKRIVEYGIESDTYMLATDCVMADADAYAESNFSELEGDSLGEWDFDYEGDSALLIASGVYEVYGIGDENETKTQARGFAHLKKDDAPEIREMIANSDRNDALPVETTRPITIGDALNQGLDSSEIGVFKTSERELSADMDGKRDWPSSVGWPDLTGDIQQGAPKVIDDPTDL